jgi:hypothetical protein
MASKGGSAGVKAARVAHSKVILVKQKLCKVLYLCVLCQLTGKVHHKPIELLFLGLYKNANAQINMDQA